VLNFLVEHPQLYSYANEIADLLEKNSREDGDGVIPSSQLSLAETLAERLWETLRDPPADAGPNSSEGWLFKAINHPGGKPAEFWLLILSRKRAETGEDWRGLPPAYQGNFDTLLTCRTYRKDYAANSANTWRASPFTVPVIRLRKDGSGDPCSPRTRVVSLFRVGKMRRVCC
jgi:hypothetical protein